MITTLATASLLTAQVQAPSGTHPRISVQTDVAAHSESRQDDSDSEEEVPLASVWSRNRRNAGTAYNRNRTQVLPKVLPLSAPTQPAIGGPDATRNRRASSTITSPPAAQSDSSVPTTMDMARDASSGPASPISSSPSQTLPIPTDTLASLLSRLDVFESSLAKYAASAAATAREEDEALQGMLASYFKAQQEELVRRVGGQPKLPH